MSDMADTRKQLALALSGWVDRQGLKKGFVAERWGITRFQMTALVTGRYSIALTDDQVTRIAEDLKCSTSELRNLYPRAA